MKQFRIKRTYRQEPIVAGGFATIDLPRQYDFESIHLRIAASLQVTVLATAVRAEAPCQLIQRAELVADGRNTLFSAPFWFTTLAKYDRAQMLESGARVTTPPSGVAVATYAVEANGVIDLMTPDGERPKDSNFRTDGLSLFQLRLTFGQPGDCFVGGAVALVAGAIVEVSTIEMVELADADNARTLPVALKKVSFQEIAIQASNANQEIRLPAGNMIKSAVLRIEGNPTAGEPTALNLNNIQMFSGTDVRVNMKGTAVRGMNNNDYGQLTTGYYVLDLARNGSQNAKLTDLWDVTNQAEPKVSMDVIGGANVKAQVVTTEYIAIR